MEHKKTVGQRFSYVFFPKEDKGTSTFDRLVLQLFGAEEVWQARLDDPQEKQLVDMLSQTSRKMGLNYTPPLLIYNSDVPNAASLANGKIVMGTSLLNVLTPGQVQAVFAHELSHHRHFTRDWTVRLGIIGATVAGLMAIFKPFTRKAKPDRFFSTANGKKILAAGGVLVGENLVSNAHQRMLENEADHEAAVFTGRPRDMSGALENLRNRIQEIHYERLKREHPELPDLKDIPEGIPVTDESASWMQRMGKTLHNLFSDHPPFSERIRQLEQMESRDPTTLTSNQPIR